MTNNIATQRVDEIAHYLIRGMMGMPISTVNNITDLTFRWLRQENPEVVDTLGPHQIKLIVEEACA